MLDIMIGMSKWTDGSSHENDRVFPEVMMERKMPIWNIMQFMWNRVWNWISLIKDISGSVCKICPSYLVRFQMNNIVTFPRCWLNRSVPLSWSSCRRLFFVGLFVRPFIEGNGVENRMRCRLFGRPVSSQFIDLRLTALAEWTFRWRVGRGLEWTAWRETDKRLTTMNSDDEKWLVSLRFWREKREQATEPGR